MTSKRKHWIPISFLILGLLLHNGSCLEKHFEPKDGGFFLRSPTQGISSSSSPSSPLSTSTSYSSSEDFGSSSISPSSSSSSSDANNDQTFLNLEHFTVLPTSQPVSIRVMYGPFSTKQTVPVRLLVPDPLENGTLSSSGEMDMIPPLDLSAHIVTPTVPKDTPILRVLFHAGQTGFGLPIQPPKGTRQQTGSSTSSSSRRHRTRLCLVAQATKSPGDVVTSSCTPDARDSTCLAELMLPIHWWPKTNYDWDNSQPTPPSLKPTKIPIQVSYSVYEPENGHCNEIGMSTIYGSGIPGEGLGARRIQIQTQTPLTTIVLTDAQKLFRIVKADASDAVKLLVPQGPLYPHTKFYVPVILGKHEEQDIVAFIMRARVKSGLRIIGIEPNIDKGWNITTDFNPRRTHATITAVRKFDPKQIQRSNGNGEEVFNWILSAAEETVDDWDAGRIIWINRYVIQPTTDTNWMKKDPFLNFNDERHKLTTRLEIQKDDIQAVLPIAKSWEVVNSAVLNGKQVSRPLKIFIVSRAGQVADVTLQASCRSLDESVLKVSSSCTSVYVDGSEIRGSTNATITIKYGTYEGSANFIVWMPEFPLDIQISDPKLQQIKGWKIPNGRETQGKRDVSDIMLRDSPPSSFSTDTNYYGPTIDDDLEDPWDHDDDNEHEHEHTDGVDQHFEISSPTSSSSSSSYDGITEREEGDDDEVDDKFHCRPRYQHSRIEVYGRFLAQDQDSGRTSYFISRKSYLKVTDLVSDYIRVLDGQVALVKTGYSSCSIQGVGPGKTEIQVVSPIIGRVLGTKELRVLNDRVSITGMKVQVISGVQLSLYPDLDLDNQFIAETTMTSKLSAKYQEALLDIKIGFSDNTWVKLDEIDKENYFLAVDSLDPSVVELPPIQNSKYPRIIAVSEGGGPIMRMSLELSDQCHRQNSSPLSISVATVEVNFTAIPNRSEFTQNDSNYNIVQSHGMNTNKYGSSIRNSKNGNSRKDRKNKENKSLLQNPNDITGIPLKDDSSKASSSSNGRQPFGPIQVGFIPDKGWTFAAHNTPLEIAMYVLLGVFSVAILVFVASCFVYASRVKKRDEAEELMGFKMTEHLAFGGLGRNGGQDWVWLGRQSLALHPSLGGTLGSSRGIPSSNPIRITTNPFDQQQQPGPGSSVSPSTPMSTTSQTSRMYGRNSGGSGDIRNLGMVLPPPRPPKPISSHNSIDSSTFSIKGDGSEVSDYRPPVPPHRNITPDNGVVNNKKSKSSSANTPTKNSKDDLPNPNYVDFSSSSDKRKDRERGEPSAAAMINGMVRPCANIVGNPMSYIDEESEEDVERPLTTNAAVSALAARQKRKHHNNTKNINSVKLDMDYDQLMEYFDNLKETEA